MLENISDLFEISYTFNLTRNNNKYDFQTPPEDKPFINKRNQYYLPKVIGEGKIPTDWEIVHLLEVLPFEFTILDMKWIFKGEKNGYNLKNILQLEETYSKESNILFLIETNDDEKFGFSMNHLIMHNDNKFYRPTTSILISIKPKLKVYTPNNESEEIIFIDKNINFWKLAKLACYSFR